MMTGSPMWTDYSVMDRFETGRVYVVYQDKQVPQSQSSPTPMLITRCITWLFETRESGANARPSGLGQGTLGPKEGPRVGHPKA